VPTTSALMRMMVGTAQERLCPPCVFSDVVVQATHALVDTDDFSDRCSDSLTKHRYRNGVEFSP
jgi:hypothetical protein